MLNELLEVAFRASTTGNMQLYSVIVTRDEENKKKLAPHMSTNPQYRQLPSSSHSAPTSTGSSSGANYAKHNTGTTISSHSIPPPSTHYWSHSNSAQPLSYAG